MFGLSEVKSSFLAGACPKNPKIEFFLVLSVFSYVFGRVKNLYGDIPEHRDILNEPSGQSEQIFSFPRNPSVFDMEIQNSQKVSCFDHDKMVF